MKHSGISDFTIIMLDSICGEIFRWKKSSILFFVKQFSRWLWFKLWSSGEQKVHLGRNGLRRVQLLWLRESSYFLFSSVRSWWNALSARRKGQKWGMRPCLAGWFTWRCVSHGQWAQQSARMQRKHTLTQEYYLLLRERHRDRISRPPNEASTRRIDNKSTAAHYPDAQNRITTWCLREACVFLRQITRSSSLIRPCVCLIYAPRFDFN